MPLVAFDFDGTLTDSEMTVLLGKRRGVAEDMAAITERAMNDEIPYAESLRERVSLLEGLSGEEVQDAFDEITLRPGAAALLNDLQQAGVTIAILTGGFQRGLKHVLEREGVEVDVIVANTLGVTDGQLNGEVSGPLVEGTKDVALTALASEEGVSLANTVVVGDGANDLPMLNAAGMAVGFNPKPAVRDACDETVTSIDGLRSVLENEGYLS